MLKAFKYKLSPTALQAELIDKHIGSARFVFNLALEVKTFAWDSNRVNLNYFDLVKQLPGLKEECTWLKEINSQSLQQPIKNLETAFSRFFKGHGRFPNFKKKSDGGSFNIPQNVSLESGRLIIPKFKEGIDIILHRGIKGGIRQATISKTTSGKYFASVLCETGEATKAKEQIKEATTIGIDLGLKKYLVTSDGKEVDNPRFLRKAQSKLNYVQRKYSKYKGKRTKRRLSLMYEKVASKRNDFLHKVSSELIKNHDSIAVENLPVFNLMRNHNISKSITDAGWSTFVNMLEYKAHWYGKNVIKIGRFEPSSKLHSSCGYVNTELTMNDRKWMCSNCGEVVDRDLNAAVNIKNFALKDYLSGEHRLKNRNELPTVVGVLTSEAIPIAQ